MDGGWSCDLDPGPAQSPHPLCQACSSWDDSEWDTETSLITFMHAGVKTR